jgi:hypothetical protein
LYGSISFLLEVDEYPLRAAKRASEDFPSSKLTSLNLLELGYKLNPPNPLYGLVV